MDTTKNNNKSNIVLIGMAGAGKSTVGKGLARLSHLGFVDVDTLIEEDQKTLLQNLLNDLGAQGFRNLEEKVLLSLAYHNHVIATGGSAIYSEAGIEHLKKSSILVYLDVALPILKQRVGDFSSRGLVKTDNQSFEQVFAERQPLYAKHAELVVDCTDRSVTDICKVIQAKVSDTFYHF
ncbi:MAG: shikimate kinase [Thermodesulfobacteriota bacterium]|nr:shikimate kinase [Thermodesulfobacteriota bacterium]